MGVIKNVKWKSESGCYAWGVFPHSRILFKIGPSWFISRPTYYDGAGQEKGRKKMKKLYNEIMKITYHYQEIEENFQGEVEDNER